MPTIPKKQKTRPWIAERKPFEGRKVDNMEFYNSKRWRTLRKVYLSRHPLCAEHLRQNMTVVAVHVDHIVPINKGGKGLEWNNLQALCLACHNKKTAKE